MDVAEANTFEVEISPSPAAILDEESRSKIVKLPKPKSSQTRKGIMSTHIAQMALLDQIDPWRLKLEPENKADCFTHSCKHCTTLLKTHWKANKSVKKGNHGGSHHTVHGMRHLKNNCSEEGLNSAIDSLQAA